MRRIAYTVMQRSVIIGLLVGSAWAVPPRKIMIRVLDGKNGAPVRNEGILVFWGRTPQQVRLHANHIQLITDHRGTAEFVIHDSRAAQMQVWVDFHALCQDAPNSRSFSIAEIDKAGMGTPNTCGTLLVHPKPGHLVVFVRTPTLRERLHW